MRRIWLPIVLAIGLPIAPAMSEPPRAEKTVQGLLEFTQSPLLERKPGKRGRGGISDGGGNVCLVNGQPRLLDFVVAGLFPDATPGITYYPRDKEFFELSEEFGQVASFEIPQPIWRDLTALIIDMAQREGSGKVARILHRALQSLNLYATLGEFGQSHQAHFGNQKLCQESNTKMAVFYGDHFALLSLKTWNQLKYQDQLGLLIHEILRQVQIGYNFGEGFSRPENCDQIETMFNEATKNLASEKGSLDPQIVQQFVDYRRLHITCLATEPPDLSDETLQRLTLEIYRETYDQLDKDPFFKGLVRETPQEKKERICHGSEEYVEFPEVHQTLLEFCSHPKASYLALRELLYKRSPGPYKLPPLKLRLLRSAIETYSLTTISAETDTIGLIDILNEMENRPLDQSLPPNRPRSGSQGGWHDRQERGIR